MQAARARMDENHQRFVAALDEYIAEETGHEQWILNDIRAAGGDPDQTVLHGPNVDRGVCVIGVRRNDTLGLAKRIFSIGTSVCPPAITLASDPCSASASKISCRDCGRTKEKRAGFICAPGKEGKSVSGRTGGLSRRRLRAAPDSGRTGR